MALCIESTWTLTCNVRLVAGRAVKYSLYELRSTHPLWQPAFFFVLLVCQSLFQIRVCGCEWPREENPEKVNLPYITTTTLAAIAKKAIFFCCSVAIGEKFTQKDSQWARFMTLFALNRCQRLISRETWTRHNCQPYDIDCEQSTHSAEKFLNSQMCVWERERGREGEEKNEQRKNVKKEVIFAKVNFASTMST